MTQTFEAFGKYILLEKLATGGMAEVYLAKNNGAGGIGKLVAIKRILPQYSENIDFIDMFKDEAKIAVNLAHSNIVSIHEFGVEREQFFLVMDYVEGRNLRQILNKMKKSGLSFSVEQVLYIIKEVAAGLDSAHRCLDRSSGKPLNITHRDMSPQNVMISFEGEVKVVDFGIAKAETQIETTRAGTLKGKFGYMSPEQAEGQVVDLRTDIFSLGIVLWELLANDRLFVANNEINTLRKIRDCQIPSLRKINPNIPAELERICNKALARDRNLRYQTSAAFHRELSRFLNRQFPDFSPHDFSVFIKTLFASEILDHRKKIVDYSRVDATGRLGPAPSASSPQPTPTSASGNSSAAASASAPLEITRPPERVQETRTEYEPEEIEQTQNTDSEAFLLGSPSDEPPAKKAPPKTREAPAQQASSAEPPLFDPHPPTRSQPDPKPAASKKPGAKINKPEPELRFERPQSLRLDSGPHEGSFANLTSTGVRGGRHYGGFTGTSSRLVEITFFSRLTRHAGASMLALVAIVAFAFYAYKPEQTKNIFWKLASTVGLKAPDEQMRSEAPGQTEIASKTYYTISITSSPPAAEVWIDGVAHPDVTPTKIRVESDRVYQITLRREQYADWHVRRKFTRDGEKLAPKLMVARVAFLDVIVEGNGEISINGVVRALRGPLTDEQIPANEDVIIRAFDRATGAEAVEKVRLGEGFRKTVKLYPKLLPRSGNEMQMHNDVGRDPSTYSPRGRTR
ncbi:MAG: protein kinase [Bdellovibrionaceae bacterium]|nr:protein kinase [Pseudobdellovibrionaceae bacterium]